MSKRKKNLESILALNMALNRRDRTSKEQSEENIQKNLVTITYSTPDKTFYGTGLMLTTDGFILTAYHVIARHEDFLIKLRQKNTVSRQSRITTADGRVYPIDPAWWAKMAKYDISLIKIIKPDKPRPTGIKFAEKNLHLGDKVKCFAKLDFKDYENEGTVTSHLNKCYGENGEEFLDMFLTNAKIRHGCSGGAFINSEGALAGIISFNLLHVDSASGGPYIKIIKAFLEKAAYNLGQRYLK